MEKLENGKCRPQTKDWPPLTSSEGISASVCQRKKKEGIWLQSRRNRAGSTSRRSASFRLCRLFFSILRRCVGFERTEKTSRDPCNGIDCGQERGFVSLRRPIKTADLSHELERSSANLIGIDRRLEVEEGFDIPAHC
jgi:hypothetical protein